MVLASRPVDSDSRLAARPVGAHSSALTCLARRMVRMELTSVVLPDARAAGDDEQLGSRAPRRIACLLARRQVRSRASARPRGWPCRRRTHGQAAVPVLQALDLLGDRTLGLVQRRQEDTGLAVDGVGDQDLVGDSWAIAASMISSGISSSLTAKSTSSPRAARSAPRPRPPPGHRRRRPARAGASPARCRSSGRWCRPTGSRCPECPAPAGRDSR